MMKVIAVGKIKENSLQKLIVEYVKRIKSYHKIEIIEVEDQRISKNSNDSLDQKIKEEEALRLTGKIKDNDYVILFDLHGQSYDSFTFSQLLEKAMVHTQGSIVFVIGGSLGLGNSILQRANVRVKLSAFTFTHQHVRLLVLEQIYRAFKIMHNETYHK